MSQSGIAAYPQKVWYFVSSVDTLLKVRRFSLLYVLCESYLPTKYHDHQNMSPILLPESSSILIVTFCASSKTCGFTFTWIRSNLVIPKQLLREHCQYITSHNILVICIIINHPVYDPDFYRYFSNAYYNVYNCSFSHCS